VGSGRGAERDLSDIVAPFLKARGEKAVGAVAARAYAEPTRPGASPTPQPSVSVMLLPYSAAFEAALDDVKAGLRDSLQAYTRAVARIEGARVDYENALLAAGGGELVRTEVTDDLGTARLGDLPAGEWLVLAWREAGHVSKHFGQRGLDAKAFPDVPTAVTYSVVSYWRARIAVRPGETAEFTATDRNVWMTAAREESGTPGSSPRPPAGGTRKRR
jgi:hypothetical protein